MNLLSPKGSSELARGVGEFERLSKLFVVSFKVELLS